MSEAWPNLLVSGQDSQLLTTVTMNMSEYRLPVHHSTSES